MLEFIRKFIMKRKLEEVNYIIELLNDRIMEKKYLVTISSDGCLQTFMFDNEDGTIDEDLVDSFLGEIRENAEDIIVSGIAKNPTEAVSLSLTALTDTATYKKVERISSSELSYVR